MLLALSGKCCAGKNYISNKFHNIGFLIIDVDVISASVFNSLTSEIIDLFGKDIVENNLISRRKVAEIIFKDSGKREELEKIIHPKVYSQIYSEIEENKDRDIIVNIPLLSNMDFINRLDAVIWIKSPLYLRVYRAWKRDKYNFITILRRIFTQKKLSVKYFKSTVDIYYIDNSLFSKKSDSNINFIVNKIRRG